MRHAEFIWLRRASLYFGSASQSKQIEILNQVQNDGKI